MTCCWQEATSPPFHEKVSTHISKANYSSTHPRILGSRTGSAYPRREKLFPSSTSPDSCRLEQPPRGQPDGVGNHGSTKRAKESACKRSVSRQ